MFCRLIFFVSRFRLELISLDDWWTLGNGDYTVHSDPALISAACMAHDYCASKCIIHLGKKQVISPYKRTQKKLNKLYLARVVIPFVYKNAASLLEGWYTPILVLWKIFQQNHCYSPQGSKEIKSNCGLLLFK